MNLMIRDAYIIEDGNKKLRAMMEVFAIVEVTHFQQLLKAPGRLHKAFGEHYNVHLAAPDGGHNGVPGGVAALQALR